MTATATAPVVTAIATADLHLGLDFRLDDDGDSLAELAASIAEVGVLQPLIVRDTPAGWEVVAGRRRLAAARIAELEEVPCVVRVLSDDEAADIALVENTHRRDLSPVEEALAYARLRDQGLTQTAIAARVGRSGGHISMLLRLLEIPEEMRDKVHRREMSYRTAIDRWGRRYYRSSGGKGGVGKLDGETAAVVTHWRRRHERLVAGIHQIIKLRPSKESEVQVLLDRLLKLDREPLPDTP